MGYSSVQGLGMYRMHFITGEGLKNIGVYFVQKVKCRDSLLISMPTTLLHRDQHQRKENVLVSGQFGH